MANRLALLATVPIFLLAAVAAFFAYNFAQTERAEQAWVIHTYQVIDATRAVLTDVERMQGTQRGYLLTHGAEYLQAMSAANRLAQTDLNSFRALTLDNASQQRHAAEMRALLAKRLALMQESLRIGQSEPPASPVLVQSLRRGSDTMQAIRALAGKMLGEEKFLVEDRERDTHASEERMLLSALAAAIFVLCIVLAAALLLARYNRRLQISEAKRAHQANILQATLDSIRDGIAVFETDNTLAAFNLNFFHLLDFPPALAHRGTPLEDFKKREASRSIQVLTPPVQGQNNSGYERVSIGGRELDIYRNFVPNEGFLVAALDVTVRVRSEANLRQAQKMEAVGQLTGGVAHDFNNLLQIISANLDLMSSAAKGTPAIAQRLQNAISAVNRGSRLTGQLLAFARRQALEPRPTNLGRLLQEMTDLLRRTLGEQVEVESIVAGGLWNTEVDPHQVENAILNLAINSRDAMPNGGKLTIELANAFLDDDYAVQHTDVTPGQYVMLAVSDTGSGIPPDVAARVFEPFFTTKPEGQGTGLGLSQVYGFVKQSGGHVKIYSELGHGTTVKLYLPRTKRAEDDAGPVTLTPIEGGSETILVVEDDEGVRAAVADMLSELGYSVLRAENAESALTVLASGAQVNLMFTDVVMPGPIPTREFVRRALVLQPGLKVLYTSGYTQNAIVHNGRLDEDVTLLSKPYRKDELARKIRSILKAPGRPVPNGATGAPAQTNVAATAQSAAKPSGKVLVVEDVALIRMTNVAMVEELGYAAAEAADGPHALNILQQDPSITILLSDIGLPGMSGKELVEKARQMRPDLRIVVASGYSSETGPDDAALRGVKFLAKPFDIGQLSRALAP